MSKDLILPAGFGKPKTVWVDKTVTYTENNEQVSFSPEDILVAAARMLRDGRSLDYIMAELDVKGLVSHRELERAILNVGMPALQRRIARGQESAESRVEIDALDAPLRPDED